MRLETRCKIIMVRQLFSKEIVFSVKIGQWKKKCLSFFGLRLLTTPLVSSNFCYDATWTPM